MCGRFSFVLDKPKIKKALPNVKVEGGLRTSFNIAPTQQAYVITNDEPNSLQTMLWGLVPFWAKEGKPTGAMINARIETILEKPSFRQPFVSHRCLVPADSFYEWRKGDGIKTPFRIMKKEDDMLFFAGIHSVWKNMWKTFAIITTEPNAEMKQIHTRMPVILRTEAERAAWLANETSEESLLRMCQTPPDGFLQMYRVSEKVNSVKHDSADLHDAVPEDLTLF